MSASGPRSENQSEARSDDLKSQPEQQTNPQQPIPDIARTGDPHGDMTQLAHPDDVGSGQLTRHQVLRKGAAGFVKLFALGVVGVRALGEGFTPPNINTIHEFLTQDGVVHLVLGNHLLPTEAQGPLQQHDAGDLRASEWPYSREFDAMLRLPGKDVLFGVDGQGIAQGGDNPEALFYLPPVDLRNEAVYSRNMFLLGADDDPFTQIAFAFRPGTSVSEAQTIVNEIGKINPGELNNPYTPEAMQRGEARLTEEQTHDIFSGLIAAAAFSAAGIDINKLRTRRDILRAFMKAGVIFASVGAFKGVENESQDANLALLAGDLPTEAGQKIATAAANLTDEGGDTVINLWTMARTAWAVEKAIDARSHAANPKDLAPTPLLYGSFHNLRAPDIMTSQTFRMQIIKRFLHDTIRRVDEQLKQYPNLLPYRDDILQSAQVLSAYTVSRVHFPWRSPGQSDTITQDEMQTVDNRLLGDAPVYSGVCPSLFQAVNEALHELGVPPVSAPEIQPQKWS